MTTFTETGTIKYDTITSSGTFSITAYGAQGGLSHNSSGGPAAGGLGAAVGGDIYLASGTVLELVIGEVGGSSLYYSGGGGGGGGGSFVFETFAGTAALTPILIAGGGGGAGSAGGGGAGGIGSSGGGGGGGKHGGPGRGASDGGGGGGGETGGSGSYPADPGSENETTFEGGSGIAGVNGGGFGGGGGGGYIGGGGGGGYGGGGGGYGFGAGGGGGGSYDADLIPNTVQAEPGENAGNGLIEIDELNTLCYLHGTRILTPTGAVAVEDLAIGDAVVTRFGGTRRIKWLGRQSYAPEFLANNPDKFPVCIKAGALEAGVPARDLDVSPAHSMLLGDILVLARDLVNGVTITQTRPESEVNYVQLDLGGHDCVLAEGAWSETYADAPGMRAQFHNAAEYEALYPDAPPAEALRLCASRPEAGPKLEAALRPVVARAGVTPGPLEGWLDCAMDWQITGWARDMAHPELPVLLEILTDDAVIGTVLAHASRADLAAAGKGNCAFSFTPPSRLRGEAVTVRRSADGAALPRTEAMRKTA